MNRSLFSWLGLSDVRMMEASAWRACGLVAKPTVFFAMEKHGLGFHVGIARLLVKHQRARPRVVMKYLAQISNFE